MEWVSVLWMIIGFLVIAFGVLFMGVKLAIQDVYTWTDAKLTEVQRQYDHRLSILDGGIKELLGKSQTEVETLKKLEIALAKLDTSVVEMLNHG